MKVSGVSLLRTRIALSSEVSVLAEFRDEVSLSLVVRVDIRVPYILPDVSVLVKTSDPPGDSTPPLSCRGRARFRCVVLTLDPTSLQSGRITSGSDPWKDCPSRMATPD